MVTKKKKKVYFARDRIGQKPLYINTTEEDILFASNLRSILDYKNKVEVDKESIDQYLAYGTNFAPRTLFKDIFKIPAAHYLEIDYEGGKFIKKSVEYWNPLSFLDNKEFIQAEFETLFEESVVKRMIADVEIANFLFF